MWKLDFGRSVQRAVVRGIFARGPALAALVAIPWCSALAAELAGVTLPDTRVVDGKPLLLNGIGLRTYSFLGIKIYVAGLYLPQRSDSAEAILNSPEPKLLEIHFLRDVDAEKPTNPGAKASPITAAPPSAM